MSTKVVFFDIDGTIWDRSNHIPESTIRAIKLLKDNGHKAFICTGRTKSYITNPDLLALGFDGMVSGLGTMIEMNGKILHYYKVDNDIMSVVIKAARDNNILPILEGKDYLYIEHKDFDNDPYGQKLFTELGDRALSIDQNENNWECSKFSCDMRYGDKVSFYKVAEKYFDILEHNSFIAEFVPKGYSKGTGIIAACKLIGIDIKDSVAIGDGVNDIDMFNTAGVSVCMGNGADKAKQHADYVTTNLMDDGIFNALEHLMLI